MIRASWVTAALLIVTLGTACSDPPKPPAPDAGAPPGGLTTEQAARVIAKVGDRTITLGDFAATLDRMDQFDRLRYQAPERRKDLLQQLVDVELLAMEAKKRGLDQEPDTQEAIRQTLRDALLADARLALPSPAEIPADEVKAYYDEHVADYKEGERRRVSAIIMGDEKKAKDVLEVAKKASDATAWGKVFFENSETAPKEHLSNVPLDLAGDLGIVGAPDDAKGANERVPDPVRAAAFKIAKIGEVYDGIVEVDAHHFYIVKLNGLTPGHDRTLAEADRSIRVLLLQKRTTEIEDKLEEDLRKKFKVEIDEAALAKLPLTLPGTPPAPSASAAASPAPSGTPSASSSAGPTKKP